MTSARFVPTLPPWPFQQVPAAVPDQAGRLDRVVLEDRVIRALGPVQAVRAERRHDVVGMRLVDHLEAPRRVRVLWIVEDGTGGGLPLTLERDDVVVPGSCELDEPEVRLRPGDAVGAGRVADAGRGAIQRVSQVPQPQLAVDLAHRPVVLDGLAVRRVRGAAFHRDQVTLVRIHPFDQADPQAVAEGDAPVVVWEQHGLGERRHHAAVVDDHRGYGDRRSAPTAQAAARAAEGGCVRRPRSRPGRRPRSRPARCPGRRRRPALSPAPTPRSPPGCSSRRRR